MCGALGVAMRHVQGLFGFPCVHRHMLRPVVHEQAFHIFHLRDEKNVADKNTQLDGTVHQVKAH